MDDQFRDPAVQETCFSLILLNGLRSLCDLSRVP